MKQSTLNLVFGNSPAYQYYKDTVSEVESIFDVVNENGSNYKGSRFTNSRFWKIFSQRIWQLDDFTFDGIAAASYLTGSHRFKIWFNPTKFYEFLYSSVLTSCIPINADINDEEAYKEEYSKRGDVITEILEKIKNGKSTEFDANFSRYGLNSKFYRDLVDCEKNKNWSDSVWQFWTNHIASNNFVSINLDSVMVHEMMHIIWNHLARLGSRDALQWNLATDYSINQTLEFSKELLENLISKNNKNFFNRFVVGTIRYLIMEDKTVKESVKKNYNLTLDNNVEEFLPHVDSLYKNYMTEMVGWQNKDKFAHMSADFYYRILTETCVFIEQPVGGDGHEMWGKESDEGEGSGEGGNSEGNGKNKAASGEGEGKDKAKAKGKDGQDPSNQKNRGKGGGQEHPGFDVSSSASRAEVKGAIRDALEKSGCDPDDPSEIEHALNKIPGMDVLGAYIKEFFKVKTKNWRQILQSHIISYLNPTQVDYTMSREDRRRKDVFPGKKKDIGLDVIIGVDTSGSINYEDYNSFVKQIEKIVRDCDLDTLRLIQCHGHISYDKKISARKIKTIPVKETGGTTMRVIYEKLKRERNKKLLILFTDGYIDNFNNEGWGFKSIMFLSKGFGCNKDILQTRGFPVICQDDEN